MAYDLALYDLISPYLLRGDSFGQWHAALAAIFVERHTIAVDEAGVVIRGVARFSGDVRPYIDPSKMSFGVNAANTEGHPAADPGRRDPWIDVRDAHLDFEITVPRVASQKVSAAVTAIGANASFANPAAVLAAYDTNPADAPPSDYPGTEFVLDLVLTTVILRPPFLRGAKLDPGGQLLADPSHPQVSFTLPRLKLRLAQGSAVNDPLAASLLSLGASGLDGTDDIGVAELVTMDPPYAFIGSSDCVGFGFRSATLDLSTGSTPPDVLSQFGFDESWTGLYLPEIRLFVAPHGTRDLAVDAGARNLLIGFGASAGVTGDFDLTVLDQGAGPLRLGARFYDAAGRSYAVTRTGETTATVQLPARTRLVVDIDGGLTPYTAGAAFDAAPSLPGRLFDCDLTAQATRTIVITATGSQAGAVPTTLTVTANRRPVPALPPPGGGGGAPAESSPPAVLNTTSVTQGGAPVLAPRLRLVAETPDTSATVALDVDPVTAALTHWTVDGVDRGTGPSVTVALPQGAKAAVRGELPGAPAVGAFTGYFRFDLPAPGTDAQTAAFSKVADNTHTAPAADEGLTAPWPPGSDAATAIAPLLAALPPGTAIDVRGYASFETGGPTKLAYNTDLARRRALGLRAIVESVAPAGKNFAIAHAPDMAHWNAAEQGDPVRNLFWKAVATWTPQPAPGSVTQGTVERAIARHDPPVPVPVPDDPTVAVPPHPPSWFKKIGAKVRIVRNQFVACEVFGRFDVQTAAENQLARGGVSGGSIPQFQGLGSQNPADGIIDVRVVVQIDDATDTVSVSGYFGADPADRDGLMMTGALPGQPLAPRSLGRNYLGMAVVFMPLLSAASDAVAGDGALAEIGVTAAVLALPFTLGSLPWVTVERVVWYGGEIVVQVRPDGDQALILLDLEAAISLDVQVGGLSLITIARDAPLTVRYKAVGLLVGNPPGQPKFQFRPAFDASKGYTIDVSKPGAIRVADPLGSILKILGARIARNNPLLFEVDLGFAIDLGVVSIERARVRMRMDPPGAPELTAFGASVDIPGALKGRGYLEINEVEIKGQLDLTLVPVQVRVAAGVGIANIPASQGGPATGVIVTLEVDFPVAIPLASSGLGIYGFLGLFAMNYARNEDGVAADNMAPALAWLKATGGDPTNIAFWKPKVNAWAFGVGAVLGTMGSSVIFNLKGVILLELPGPRLLLMMKANLLAAMPDKRGTAEGTFLAVIDLDFGRGTLTIGLSIDFEVDPLLEIGIPVEAFFNFNDSGDWHLFLGQYVNQVHARVLQVFDASGYLMLSGNGISGIPRLPAVTGFSIATGLHVSFTWGGGPLYARLAAGFDAVVGFSPFRMAGILSVRGTLHLFILDISAWAELTVDVGTDAAGGKVSRITGEICGRVEFLFFSIEGCVSFSLGDDAVPIPPPPKLVTAAKLVSRSPALVVGTGVDKPIDSGIGDAAESDNAPAAMPVVPIDAIPVLMMAMPPTQAPGLKFLGQDINGTPEVPNPDGFNQRGDVWFKYTISNVELIGPVTPGLTPATWWKPKAGDAAIEAQLALLSWVPEATPKAVGSSSYLDELVTEHWGTTCQPAAPAAPVLFTFLGELLGPSDTGWDLTGTAWPDPPNAARSAPPDVTLRVSERWRCGDPAVDRMRGIVPAQVEGATVACPERRAAVNPGRPVAGVGPLADVAAPVADLVARPRLVAAGAGPVGAARRRFGPPAINNPITSIRGGDRLEEVVPGESLALATALQRFNLGQAVSRSTLLNLAVEAPPGPVAVRTSKCFARALASPVFDEGNVIAFGPLSREGRVKEAWKRRRFKPGPLDDAVVFHTGDIEYADFYLWVPRRFVGQGVVVVAVTDAADTVLRQHVVTAADQVPPASFPVNWTGPGPWRDRVTLLVEMEQARRETYVGVRVRVRGAGGDRVQVAALPDQRRLLQQIRVRPFYVAAVEVLRRSEAVRQDYDDGESKKKQGVLATALGLDSADNALLVQDQVYQVRVTYGAERERRPQGSPATDRASLPPDTQQSFWFKTDSRPPARLDPWVLVALPGEAERHCFAAEAIRIVFATNNVALLYAAYGKKLQARLKPSSFRPVAPPAGVPHPFPLNAATLAPVAASVLSPWEAAVAKLAASDLPCVPIAVDRTRHTMVTLPIPLDLATDYVIDIEVLDAAAADGSPGERVWRGSFATGMFRTLDEFANSFQTGRVGHRGVHAEDAGKLQSIGATFAAHDPQGAEFDAALTQAGLDAQGVARSPRAVIFWEPGAPDPQPVAVLLDASEPMWRERPIPKEVADPGPALARRYELVPTPWLTLAQQPGGDDVVAAIVRAPGDQRALVTLKPGSRGKRVRLALRRVARPEPYLDGPAAADQLYTVLDLSLTAAPWEEVD